MTRLTVFRNSAMVAAAIFVLASCRTVQPYVPPADGDTARLLVRPTLPGDMSYGLYTFEDAHACRNMQRMVTGNGGTGNQSSKLHAGPLSTLVYLGRDHNRLCRVSFSFYPKARHTYLLATSQDSARCAVRLLDATDGDNPRPEKSFVRRTMSGGGCDPLNKNVRAGDAINESYQGSEQGGASAAANTLDDFKDLLPK